MEMTTMVLGLLAELTSFEMQYVHLFVLHEFHLKLSGLISIDISIHRCMEC